MSQEFQRRQRRLSGTLAESDKRSQEIETAAYEALAPHSHFRGQIETIRIKCRCNSLIILGRVPSFYLKQLVQEALRQVDGVNRIDNRIEVAPPIGRGNTSETSPLR